MKDIPPPVPLWGWYIDHGCSGGIVKAIHMDKDFTFTTTLGSMRGRAGEWLIEERNGRWQAAYTDEYFRAICVPYEPRPEMVQPPDPAPPPLAPEVEPPTA